MRTYTVTLEVESDAVIGEGDVEQWEKNEIKNTFEQRFSNPNYTASFLMLEGMIKSLKVKSIEKQK